MTEVNAEKIKSPELVKKLQDHKNFLLTQKQSMPATIDSLKEEIARHSKIIELLEKLISSTEERSAMIDNIVKDIDAST